MAHKASFKELFRELIEVSAEMGWTIAMPIVEDGEDFPGLILGEYEYVKRIINKLPTEDQYEIFKKKLTT